MLLTCDGDRHVYQWGGADVSAPPPGTVCKCGKTTKGETPQAQIAELTARLDQAQAMILERDQRIAELETDLRAIIKAYRATTRRDSFANDKTV